MADLYESGWRQGSIFHAELAASWLGRAQAGLVEHRTEVFPTWVVCTQDCDLRGAPIEAQDPQIEIRPVLSEAPPSDWGIRSRRLRLTETMYVDVAKPRLMVTADLLASLGPPATALTDARAKAFKTWLGLRYDRPAIPERLVDLAREVATRCGSRSGRAAAENVHEVLMQFDESDDPPKVALFAIVAAEANRDVVRAWLAEASTRISTALGVVAHIDVATKEETSITLIENSYAADLSQLTWRDTDPTGAT